jgi:hypothetical protein
MICARNYPATRLGEKEVVGRPFFEKRVCFISFPFDALTLAREKIFKLEGVL